MTKEFWQNMKEGVLGVFKYWSCALLLVLLPADFLYRVDSFLSAQSLTGIAVDASLLVVIFVCTALLLAVIIGPASVLIASLLGKKLGRLLLIGNNLLVWLFVDLILIIYVNLWAATVISAHHTLRHVLVLTIFLLFNLVLLVNVRKMADILGRAFKVVPLLTAISLVVIVVKLTAASFPGTQPVAAPSASVANKPNLILITFDALSAADMSLYGYHRDTTPNMAQFAQKAFVFDRMYSNSNHTSPSVCSILTSTYPSQHKVYNNFMALSEEARRDNLAAVLKRNGYTTAAVMANPQAHPWNNRSYADFSYLAPVPYVSEYVSGRCYNLFTPILVKLDSNINNWAYSVKGLLVYHSFKYFLKYLVTAPPMQPEWYDVFLIGNKNWNTQIMNPPELTFQEASRFLDSKKKGPFFLWVHVFTPHAPYLPPDRFKYRYLAEKQYDTALSQNLIYGGSYDSKEQPKIDRLRARYDEMILYTDYEFGRFAKKLEKDGLLDNSLVLVSADHGEIFEKGEQSHGGERLNQPLIHVPLMVHLPGQHSSSRIQQNVQQVDLAPTMLAAVGLPAPEKMQGRSFLGMMTRGERGEQNIFSMNLEQNYQKAVLKYGVVAVVSGKYKYVHSLENTREELYDLQLDPGENDNLAQKNARIARDMKEMILRELRLRVLDKGAR